MLTIWGKKDKRRSTGNGFCDGFSRRSFLQIGGSAVGGAAMGGMALNDVLAMEKQAGTGSSQK